MEMMQYKAKRSRSSTASGAALIDARDNAGEVDADVVRPCKRQLTQVGNCPPI